MTENNKSTSEPLLSQQNRDNELANHINETNI